MSAGAVDPSGRSGTNCRSGKAPLRAPATNYTVSVDSPRSGARPGTVLAAFALLALAIGISVAASACNDSPSDTLGPGIWIAAVRPGPEFAAPQPFFEAPIRVLEAVSGKERTFGPPSTYLAVSWSPSGDRLAALGFNKSKGSGALQLRLWDASGKVIFELSYEGAEGMPDGIDWSPDGTRLAVTTTRGAAILDSSGRHLGEALSTPGANGSSSTSSVVPRSNPWSPDSQNFATGMNGLLLMVDRYGHGGEYELPPTNPANVQRMIFEGWRGPVTLAALGVGRDTVEYEGLLQTSKIAWDAGKPAAANAFIPGEQRLAAYANLMPGMAYAGERRSADGSALAVRLAPPGRAMAPMSVPIALAIELDGRTTVVDLGFANLRFEAGTDVLIRPGWKGNAPGVVKAATPLPTAGPSPTEVARPTRLASASPFPDTGPPYPAPRGERVPPLVAGLPAYPGAQEIDGFSRSGPAVTGNVQMFGTADTEAAVLGFFEQRLVADGFASTGGSHSPQGEQKAYTRGRDRVLVSTMYIPRAQDELPNGAVSYGFQGKGNRFVDTIAGQRFFYVVTLRAPDPS